MSDDRPRIFTDDALRPGPIAVLALGVLVVLALALGFIAFVITRAT